MFVVIAKESHLPIIGGTPAEAILKELVEFSEKKQHWFGNPQESAEAAKTRTDPRPEGGHHAPNSRHFAARDAISGGEEMYHVSFTITKGQMTPEGKPEEVKDVLLRHATIAVGDLTRVVDLVEAFTILKFLGFETKNRMMATKHPDFEAGVFFEPLTEEEEARLRG